MGNMNRLFLNGDQRERLVSLLEEHVDDHGIAGVSRFIKPPKSPLRDAKEYISSVLNEDGIVIDSFLAAHICECLAINPYYIFRGSKPIYTN